MPNIAPFHSLPKLDLYSMASDEPTSTLSYSSPEQAFSIALAVLSLILLSLCMQIALELITIL
jgi:hypothetical protein